jgi:hypothetical protein
VRTPSFFQGSDDSWYYSVVKGYDKIAGVYSFEREGPFNNYYEARAAWAYDEEQRDAIREEYGW